MKMKDTKKINYGLPLHDNIVHSICNENNYILA